MFLLPPGSSKFREVQRYQRAYAYTRFLLASFGYYLSIYKILALAFSYTCNVKVHNILYLSLHLSI